MPDKISSLDIRIVQWSSIDGDSFDYGVEVCYNLDGEKYWYTSYDLKYTTKKFVEEVLKLKMNIKDQYEFLSIMFDLDVETSYEDR